MVDGWLVEEGMVDGWMVEGWMVEEGGMTGGRRVMMSDPVPRSHTLMELSMAAGWEGVPFYFFS